MDAGLETKNEHVEPIVAEVRQRAAAEESELASTLAQGLYEWVPREEVARRNPHDLAGAALSLLELARKRRPGQLKIRFFNPSSEADGWQSKHTALQIVNDDMPFLVDSVTSAIARHHLEIHLLAHPQFVVERDVDGGLTHLESHAAGAREGANESFMHLEIDRVVASGELEKLKTLLEDVLGDVRAAVEDWPLMRQTVRELIEELAANPPPVPAEEVDEAREFLEWLDDNHFTYLGSREYLLIEQDGRYLLRPDRSTDLGLLRRSAGNRTAADRPLTPAEIAFLHSPQLLSIGKSTYRATVHRPVQMDAISVKRYDAAGEAWCERRLLGLFTSTAYTSPAIRIPILRRKVEQVVRRAGFLPASHDAKALGHILEDYPRDELFQINADDLYRFSLRALELHLRPRLALFVRRDEGERFVSCLIHVPRDHYTTAARERMLAILARALGGEIAGFDTRISDDPLATVRAVLRLQPGAPREVDVAALERELAEVAHPWSDQLREALAAEHSEEVARDLWRKYEHAFPTAYREQYRIAEAIVDVTHLEGLLAGTRFDLRLDRKPGMAAHRFYCKTFELGKAAPLSSILPRFENMGLEVISEIPFEVKPRGVESSLWVRDFELVAANRQEVDLEAIGGRFKETFLHVCTGKVENDGFNRLVLHAGLGWREVVVLRACCRYLSQVGIAFSQRYMEEILGCHPVISRLLVELFYARLDPQRAEESEERQAEIRAAIEIHLGNVQQLDEDRILRRFLNLVEAMVRTNHFQKTSNDAPKPYLSLKFDSSKVQGLPLPRPMFEVFVYSPRVEAVHLRGGKVARGGIRWSDRREDFRTEILGLVKAQMVKNAVIVPVGAKGGFVVKQPPTTGGREAFQAEGIECYKTLIRGLLDLTDNRQGDQVIHPPDVVRHDADDPYLVVAADKGTATFSDVANGVSAEYGFWLGDAFASGGSAGYDHKKMAITARGAWESVKQHFRDLGRNIQEQDFTVVGVGDMSGDVFGNGMLLSKHIRLLGAFDHRHVFVDPNPDPAISWAERKRLFELPRSSWADYDPSLLSAGAGIFPRDAKSIGVSREVQQLFELPSTETSPNELMRALLRAPVDLLWFGGIGTYVKASQESHERVGDRTNNELRVDATELRAKVIGEGANLGLTQAGRIEYALQGGRLNTDFIDNSGGVDCSDHEVNIKIALADVVARGQMTREERDQLLGEMTEQVGELVLRDNYLQSQAITLTESHGGALLGEQAQLMRELERSPVRLDRRLETLPDEEALARRRSFKRGLTRPEIAILLAYSKLHVYGELLDSKLPDDPQLTLDLVRYFPSPMQDRFREPIERHRLRREIIATHVTNSMVNRVGPSFVVRMVRETGAEVSEIARAYTAARDVFELRQVWEGVEALDNKVPMRLQLEMYLESVRLIESTTRWFLRHIPQPLDISATVERFHAPAATLALRLDDVLSSSMRNDLRRRTTRLRKEKVPIRLARRVAGFAFLPSACDIAKCAEGTGGDVERAGKIYFALGERFGFYRLRRGAARLERDNLWQKTAIDTTLEELAGHQAKLTRQVAAISAARVRQAIETWAETRRGEVDRVDQVLERIDDAGAIDLAVLTVAERELRRLAGG